MRAGAACALLAAPALICAAPIPSFAPRDGAPYRCTVSQLRTINGKSYRATIVRRIVFRRTADGWTADVSPDAIESADRSPAVAALRRTLAGATDDTRVMLDDEGRIVGVEALDAAWASFMAHARVLGGERMAAPLAMVPSDQRVRMIASPIADIVAMEDIAKPIGDRAVSVPGAIPGGAPIVLTGSEHVAADGALRLIVTKAATGGTAPLPLAADPNGAPLPATTDLVRTRLVDPATGLIVRSIETQHTVIAGAPASADIITQSTTTLASW